MEAIMLEKEIKELTIECMDTKAQAFGLPSYHHASEWATGSNDIATNTLWNEPSSPEEGFSLETAALETRAMRQGTYNGAEPASTLHQHAAYIKERTITSAGTKTV